MIFPGQPRVGYLEVADILRGRIMSGQLRPGQRLPSERDLSQTYDISIKTARAALMQLRNEGLAVAIVGYGVCVREAVEPELVAVEPDAAVSARNPTPRERAEYQVPDGVPLLVVIHPDGLQDLYPADRYRLVYQHP